MPYDCQISNPVPCLMAYLSGFWTVEYAHSDGYIALPEPYLLCLKSNIDPSPLNSLQSTLFSKCPDSCCAQRRAARFGWNCRNSLAECFQPCMARDSQSCDISSVDLRALSRKPTPYWGNVYLYVKSTPVGDRYISMEP